MDASWRRSRHRQPFFLSKKSRSRNDHGPLCPASYPPQSVAACPLHRGRAILSPWGPNHARRSTAHPSGQRQSGERKADASRPARGRGVEQAHARLKGPAQPLTTLGDASTLGTAISKSVALAAIRTRPLPSTLCADRRRRQVHELERIHALPRVLEVRRYRLQAKPPRRRYA